MTLSYGTPDTQAALDGLRDLSTLEWYVIPLLAIVFYIYGVEIKKARKSGNWDAIICALTVFGMDFFNETWNGWICWLTQSQAFWTTPGESALRTMVGWNIEIMFMFALNGFVYYNFLSENKEDKILGIPNQWFWAIGLAAFCVLIECALNIGGHLTWTYPWWKLSFGGVWLIFLFGYFHFYVACILVLRLKTLKKRIIALASIYGIAILMNVLAGILGWVY
jgi:hypothetical protein